MQYSNNATAVDNALLPGFRSAHPSPIVDEGLAQGTHPVAALGKAQTNGTFLSVQAVKISLRTLK